MAARVQREMAAEVPQRSPNRSKTALVNNPANGWVGMQVQMQTAARLWEGLIRECKTDPHTRHVYVLLKEKKRALRARARFTRESASSTLEELDTY